MNRPPAGLRPLGSVFALALTFTFALAALPAPIAAQDEQEAPEEAQEEESPYKDLAELTEGFTHQEGFFDTWAKDDKLYMAVPPSMVGEPFLMEAKIARGIGARGLFGGTMLNLFEGDLVAIERHGETLYLVQRPHRFHAEGDDAAARAVDLTFGSSVLETAKIESVRDDDGALVVDVHNWFVSDLSGISQRVRFAVSTQPGRPGTANFDQGRSYLESVKGFPRNVNVRAKLTFRPGEPVNMPSVPDGRYIPVSIHYSLAQLPEEPMAIRYGDDRVGNFMTVHKDFAQEDSTFFVRIVNRWRLERGERVGDKWRPRQPITYYIDHTVPDEYRQPFKDGVEAWNAAFEEAGFVDAIRALDLPEDADAEDIRYATLRWNVSDQVGYGAIGPSTVDPRTGEILDADLLFEANMFLGFRNSWRTVVNPVTASEAFEAALLLDEGEWNEAPGTELSSFAEAFVSQGALLGTVLAARGDIDPGDPVPDEFLHQAVRWVTMHEVGHSLGLQHNFRSSASTPFARLHDQAWAEENGVFSSVMEYPTVNISPRGSDNGYYYNPGIGSYDRWVVAYGYTPDDARAAELARDAADKRHLFGTNADASASASSDPSVNVYDLSDDPLEWGKQRTAIVEGLWNELPAHVLEDDGRYYDVTVAFQNLMNDYARAMAPAVKYIGGQYVNRDHVGDRNGRPPLVGVPVAEQREALEFIIEQGFSADAFRLDTEVLGRMGPNRWLHWGSNGTFQGRVDFPYHEVVAGFQRSLLGQLLNPFKLARIRDAETRWGSGSVVTIPELMGALTGAVWSEIEGAPANIEATRRDLQRSYLDVMTDLIVDPPSRTPADARSVARHQLRGLSERIDGALGTAGAAGLDAYTLAHLEEARARIDKALEAGLEAEGGAN